MGISSKRIIEDTLKLKKTPRRAVSILSGGAWTLNRRGLTLEKALKEGPETIAGIIAETNKLVKSDIVWAGSGYHNLGIKALGGNIKFRAKGTPDVLEPLLPDVDDIKKVDFSRLLSDEYLNVLWDTAGFLKKTVCESITVGASQWGPFTLAGHFYGVEKLMRQIKKDKNSANRVLEFSTEFCFQYLEPFIEKGVDIISVADPTASGDLISRSQFEEFTLPYLKKLIGRLKERGVAVCLHICGNITNHLDLIPESGADMISLDYKVSLAKAREVLGNRIAFAGNMNPVAVMQNASREEVRQACIQCIKDAGEDSSYILMPGCDIPPTVPIENLQEMVSVAHEYMKN